MRKYGTYFLWVAWQSWTVSISVATMHRLRGNSAEMEFFFRLDILEVNMSKNLDEQLLFHSDSPEWAPLIFVLFTSNPLCIYSDLIEWLALMRF